MEFVKTKYPTETIFFILVEIYDIKKMQKYSKELYISIYTTKKFDFRRGYFAEVVRNLNKLTLLGMILQII